MPPLCTSTPAPQPPGSPVKHFGARTDKMWAVWCQVLTLLEEREQPVVRDLWQEEGKE